jgi:hypothetical protein
MARFVEPSFQSGVVEVRLVDGEVDLYANQEGLLFLARTCSELAARLRDETEVHRHLEDFFVLTPASLNLVIAGFREMGT